MNLYLSLPFLFLKFWYVDSPLRLIRFFFSLNHTVLQILSLPLLARTFFRPIKNEYRKGLVVFSIGMGIVVKGALIFIDLIIFGFIILLEITSLMLFLAWPFLTVYILFV